MNESVIRNIVREVLKEYISRRELGNIEDYADDLFSNVNVDVEFTDHFVDRLNDPRNITDIESDEMKGLFSKLYMKYGQKIPNYRDGTHALVTDMNTNINIPFELKWDKNKKMFNMINTTVLRTDKFFVSTKQAPHMKLRV